MEFEFIKRIGSFNYSYAVILPKVWADQHGIGRRDKIKMTIQHDGSLLIRPIKEIDKSTFQEPELEKAYLKWREACKSMSLKDKKKLCPELFEDGENYGKW